MAKVVDDIYFLEKTLSLAKKGEGLTSPNPLVGAVIVKKGVILSTGYHRRCGKAHAEIEAIRKIPKKNIKGATLYVNVEPCSHYGRTPPCVDEIIACRFKRVVIAHRDPNPLVRGRSIKKLRSAGISVCTGLLKEEARRLNEVFFKTIREPFPFVVAKVAQSLDGKIATAAGESKWITSLSSRKYARALRDRYDCVLVGINTVIKDNPGLGGVRKIPYRAIIDPHLRIPPKSRLLKSSSEIFIFTSAHAAASSKRRKLPSGVNIIVLPYKNKRLSLKKILKSLYQHGVMSVFVEGGSHTLGGFFDERVVDKVYFFIAPKIIGGADSLSSVGGRGIRKLPSALSVNKSVIERRGADVIISGYLK